MKNSISILFLSLMLIIVSCKKGDTLSNNGSTQGFDLRAEINDNNVWLKAKHDDNPSDSIGLIHNLLLDYLFSKKKMKDFNSVYSCAKDYFVDVRGYSYNLDKLDSFIYEKNTYSNILVINDVNTFKELSSLYHEKELSYQYNKYLDAIFGVLDYGVDICTPEYEKECITDYLIDQIKLVEVNILNDQTLINIERERLLISASVMRYSLLYWSNKNDQNVAKIGKFWRAFIRASADVVGAVVGASVDVAGIPTGVGATLGAGIASRFADDLLK